MFVWLKSALLLLLSAVLISGSSATKAAAAYTIEHTDPAGHNCNGTITVRGVDCRVCFIINGNPEWCGVGNTCCSEGNVIRRDDFPPGHYRVEVRPAVGCDDTASVVEEFDIINPPCNPPQVSASGSYPTYQSVPECDDGFIRVNARSCQNCGDRSVTVQVLRGNTIIGTGSFGPDQQPACSLSLGDQTPLEFRNLTNGNYKVRAFLTSEPDCVTESRISLFRYFADADSDGYGDPARPVAGCRNQPPPSAGNVAENSRDCDDTRADINPNTVWYFDGDGDGFGTDSNSRRSCEAPDQYVAKGGDCDDTSDRIHPGASGRPWTSGDFNCDGIADNGLSARLIAIIAVIATLSVAILAAASGRLRARFARFLNREPQEARPRIDRDT
jgi:hypothetical protein